MAYTKLPEPEVAETPVKKVKKPRKKKVVELSDEPPKKAKKTKVSKKSAEVAAVVEAPKPKKKASAWVDHVKAVQKKEGISYKAAMSKASATYKK